MTKKIRLLSSTLFLLLLFKSQVFFGQTTSEPFDFQFENKTLRGFIETPTETKSKAIVFLIPGYGKTNFAGNRSFYSLRKKLLEFGLTVVVWDKMGCGNSEGVFDPNQDVGNSAEEAIVAIKKIKQLKIAEGKKVGLWGLSRAGWICPLILEKYPMDFWISVSGPSDKENYGYLLKSNLAIAGKNEKDVEKLYQSWKLRHKIFSTNGSYDDYVKVSQPLASDSIVKKLFGIKVPKEVTEEARINFKKAQKSFTENNTGYFDYTSGLWVYINEFDKTLNTISCPVLAIFGENDSQVDWRESIQLYKSTMGKNLKSGLTIKTFKACNHNINKCKTCAYREDLSDLNWATCDGYYETMKTWLKNNKFID